MPGQPPCPGATLCPDMPLVGPPPAPADAQVPRDDPTSLDAAGMPDGGAPRPRTPPPGLKQRLPRLPAMNSAEGLEQWTVSDAIIRVRALPRV